MTQPRLVTHPVPATELTRELDPTARRRATLAVASVARDAADCALLLDALGLDAREGQRHAFNRVEGGGQVL